ncbi:MAG: hypothetical protein R6U52_08890 [Kosmotogaceae bacterium]
MKKYFVISVLFVILFIFASCPGSFNKPPLKPSSPIPDDEAENQPQDITVSWECSDPENDPLKYDIYVGKETLEIFEADLEDKNCFLYDLEAHTLYKWRIVAKDDKGNTTKGDIWSFTTRNNPPEEPFNPDPPDEATNVPTDTELSWECVDPDGDPLLYSIYFGEDPLAETIVATSFEQNEYEPGGLLEGTTYYWKIVVNDDFGGEAVGPIWSFTTLEEGYINNPPVEPFDPQPEDKATDTSIETNLKWDCSDPDGDSLFYVVYFGTDPEVLTTIATSFEQKECWPGTLNYDTTYFWKIYVEDGNGGEITGPLWSFTTEQEGNNPPEQPSNPTPPDGSSNISVEADLSWDCSDPDGDSLIYDVFFGTTNPPTLVSLGQTADNYDPGVLTKGTTYFWKIKARDGKGGQAVSPIWSFHTEEEGNNPPSQPTDYSPVDGSTDVSVNTTLSWNCSDPDGDSLIYDVFFGTVHPPPLVSLGQIPTTYDPGTLNYETDYYWKIKARDGKGGQTVGPIISFKTIEDHVVFEEDFETGDFSSHNWIRGGSKLPIVQSAERYEGGYAVKFGNAGYSYLEITLNLSSDSAISFFRKTSSYPEFGKMSFYIDSDFAGEWYNDIDWKEVIREVPSGVHKLRWEYSNNATFTGQPDFFVWLDYIRIFDDLDLGALVNVPDSDLKDVMRYYLGKNPSPSPIYTKYEEESPLIPTKLNYDSTKIHEKELLDITGFRASNKSISNITGLEYMHNLKYLRMSHINISDLTPLANLTDLEEIFLIDSQIVDITPLQNLTRMEILDLHGNNVSNLSPLIYLTELFYLDLDYNQVTNINSLVYLTKLVALHLDGNQITDTTPLQNLTNLWSIHLDSNQISDIQPLVNNSGLGSGDYLYIRNNNLDLTTGSEDMENIQILQERGVTVYY